ncbi:energy-coupled thiamine transporter ThiT [Spiroplasma endosymbiont of Cantharis nigra]|uniref:energy-coupled thiamine transporter ThiT n=1 Tax=Spiroplasma endosymbiont of Cantharis nigra TaxID=3066278 RepID=UPI0030CFDDD4
MNKKIIKLSITLSTIRILICLGLVIWAIITIIEAGDQNGSLLLGKIITISFCFSLFFVLFTLINFSLILNIILDKDNFNKKNIMALAFITLNLETLIYYLSKQDFKFKKIKMKRWTIFDITSISLLLALYFSIGFVTGLIPPMPFYITLTFKYIPLFFGAFILSISASITLCFLAATLSILLPGAYLQFWQFFFDYWLPTLLIFTAGFFTPNVKTNKMITKIGVWFAFISIPIIFLYFSRVTSGVVYWLNPNKIEVINKEFNWANNIGYSFIYNSINTIFDYILLIICIPSICESLWTVKDRFFYNRNLTQEEYTE